MRKVMDEKNPTVGAIKIKPKGECWIGPCIKFTHNLKAASPCSGFLPFSRRVKKR